VFCGAADNRRRGARGKQKEADMNVYLLRHGEAEPAREGSPDSERALSPEGEKMINDILPGMKKLIPQVEYILTSPFARAFQTASIVAKFYNCAGFIENVETLAGPGGEEKINSLLNKLIGKDQMVIVGHEPHLSGIAKYYCGAGLEDGLKLKKGGMAKIYIADFPGPGKGALRWTMTPEEIARV
jgi:phosphohistidine phosphatase